MQRGVSPIVAVVLLIAIAVISAVGLYFWAGGLATKQATPNTPVAITATPLDNGRVLIANLGSAALSTSGLTTAEGLAVTCDEASIPAGGQVACDIPPRVGTTTIYSPDSGSTTITLTGGDVAPVTFQGTGFSTQSWYTWGGTHSNTTAGSVLLSREQWIKTKIVNNPGTIRLQKMVMHDDVLHLTWGANDDGHYDVFYANSSNNWAATKIEVGSAVACSTAVGVGTDDVVHLSWYCDRAGVRGVWYANSSTGFTPKSILNCSSGYLYNDLAVGPGDVIHITFDSNRHGDYEIYYANSSSGWAINNATSDTFTQTFSSVSVGPNGVVHIGYLGMDDGDYDVYYTNSSSGWAKNLVYNDTCADVAVMTKIGSDNVLHMVWNDGCAESDMWYTSSARSGWAVTQIPDAGAGEWDAGLFLDSSDNPYIAWEEGDGDIHYATSVDGWADHIIANQSYAEWHPVGAIDSSGIIHVVFKDQGDGEWDLSYANSTQWYWNYGAFLSDALDTGFSPANFTGVSWTNSTPAAGTFQLKLYLSNVSDFATNTTLTPTNGQTGLGYSRYAKYWVNMTTTDRAATPLLSAFALNYVATAANITYTINSASALSWVALNRTCGGTTATIANNTASGTFYTNTSTNQPGYCSFVAFGPNVQTTSYP